VDRILPHDAAAEPASSPEVHSTDPRRERYEAPALSDLGTIAELTRGVSPTTSDGLGPGSAL
jgi:hypothetical protein